MFSRICFVLFGRNYSRLKKILYFLVGFLIGLGVSSLPVSASVRSSARYEYSSSYVYSPEYKYVSSVGGYALIEGSFGADSVLNLLKTNYSGEVRIICYDILENVVSDETIDLHYDNIPMDNTVNTTPYQYTIPSECSTILLYNVGNDVVYCSSSTRDYTTTGRFYVGSLTFPDTASFVFEVYWIYILVGILLFLVIFICLFSLVRLSKRR